jgi:Na+/H+ antiporter NhaD/arsenite permease-like protein
MPPPPALAAFGCFLFLLAWLAMAKDRWACLPRGRAVSVAAIGALFVASSLLSPSEAFAAINVPTLALLLGCMLISGVMEKHGAYSMLQEALASGASSPALLLLRLLKLAPPTASATRPSCGAPWRRALMRERRRKGMMNVSAPA